MQILLISLAEPHPPGFSPARSGDGVEAEGRPLAIFAGSADEGVRFLRACAQPGPALLLLEGEGGFSTEWLSHDVILQRVPAETARASLADIARASLGVFSASAEATREEIRRLRAAEDALQQSEGRFRDILDNSRDLLYRYNMETQTYDYLSPVIEELVGIDPETYTAGGLKLAISLLHPDDREGLMEILEPLFQRSVEEIFVPLLEYRLLHADGAYRWFSEYRTVIRDDEGNPTAIVGNSRDITRERREQERRWTLEQRINLAQRVESVGRLAGGVSHDLNNMLTPVLCYAEMMSEDVEDEEQHEALQEIIKAAGRARDLTRQLLAFSRSQPLDYRALELVEVVRDFSSLLRRTIREDIDVHFIYGDEEHPLLADRVQLEQVLMNLVVNAAEAIPGAGRITIETARVWLQPEEAAMFPGAEPGPYMCLVVSDTGCGMDAELLGRIYEPFFTTKGKRGSGLGLATVHGIVAQHGGFIAVSSEVGAGTRFEVFFPRASGEAAETPAPAEARLSLRGTETVLLVEDEAIVRTLAEAILTRKGYTVVCAADGASALELLPGGEVQVDLLLTDVVMPGMDGMQLYERARALQPDLRVVFMSGYTDNVLTPQGVLDGRFVFLRKPFTVNGLATRVREALERIDR